MSGLPYRQETDALCSAAEQEEAETAASGKPDGSGSSKARETKATVKQDQEDDDDDDGSEGERDPDVTWKLEVEETFLRCIQLRFDPVGGLIGVMMLLGGFN